jgi:hypothetical protein
MISLLRLIFVCVLVAFAALEASAASGDRVCCRKDGVVQWSTRDVCASSGGEQTYNDTCRKSSGEGERICCGRLRSDWWSTRAQCVKDGGGETFNKSCRDDSWNTPEDDEWNDYRGDWEAQVCCQRGEAAMWTSARVCRTGGGKQTFNKACRAT